MSRRPGCPALGPAGQAFVQGCQFVVGEECAGELLALNGRAGRRTIDGYKDTYNRVIAPALAGVRLKELTTGRLDRFLKNVAADHPSASVRSGVDVALAM